MAAQNTDIILPKDEWTLITATGVSVLALTFQNKGTGEVLVLATATEVAPTSNNGAVLYVSGKGEPSSRALSVLWPGVSGTRVYAKALTHTGLMMSSHTA